MRREYDFSAARDNPYMEDQRAVSTVADRPSVRLIPESHHSRCGYYKRNTNSTRDVNGAPVAFSEYINTHHVFTTKDIIAVSGNPQAANVLLHSALKRGKVERVRRGVYVSRTGVFAAEPPNPFGIVLAADPDAVLVYHSAFVAWGVAHNLLRRYPFRSSCLREAFAYGGIDYKPLPYRKPLDVERRAVTPERRTACVTSKEQTLVDALSAPEYCGGMEEVVRACTQFAYLDSARLLDIVRDVPHAVCARVGWLLEQKRADWRIGDDALSELRTLISAGGVRLRPFVPGSHDAVWVDREWNLTFPLPRREVQSWVSRRG